MRKAVISNGIVTNIIEAPAGFRLPGVELVRITITTGQADIGGAWDGTTFASAPPSSPPPESQDRRAIRALAAVIDAGTQGAVAAVETEIGPTR